MKKLKFDDIINDEYGTYTQVCNACKDKYKLNINTHDLNGSIGICGVLGCNSESQHYYNLGGKTK